MKKYLKIGNLFDGGVGFSARHTNEQVRAGTHAINSHDELVAMNKELLEALESMVRISHLSVVNSVELNSARDAANSAIAKAKAKS